MFLEIQVIFSGQSCVLKEHCYPVVHLYLICWCTWTRSSAERILVVVILSWGNWLFLAFKTKFMSFLFVCLFFSLYRYLNKVLTTNVKQSWLPAVRNKIKIHKTFKKNECLFWQYRICAHFQVRPLFLSNEQTNNNYTNKWCEEWNLI